MTGALRPPPGLSPPGTCPRGRLYATTPTIDPYPGLRAADRAGWRKEARAQIRSIEDFAPPARHLARSSMARAGRAAACRRNARTGPRAGGPQCVYARCDPRFAGLQAATGARTSAGSVARARRRADASRQSTPQLPASRGSREHRSRLLGDRTRETPGLPPGGRVGRKGAGANEPRLPRPRTPRVLFFPCQAVRSAALCPTPAA
jgi:hypothetical protein